MLEGRICFVGAGAMAEAILCGMLNHKIVKPGQISVTNRDDRFRLDELVYNFGVVGDSSQKYRSIQEADILILAMKPKDISTALEEIRAYTSQEQLVISVIAGISTKQISEFLGHQAPVIRTMPNTSAIVGLSGTGVCAGEFAKAEHIQVAREIFEAIGLVIVTDEEKLDAITGLSGSGPAYVYYLVEAMLEGGKAVGLSEQEAKDLILQTVIGAANMLIETNESPAYLREKVTSPNGTTQAGLDVLKQYQFQEAVKQCVVRATERSKELGAQSSVTLKKQ
ncbi:pyrroline-5-carboxylate reductase [Bacillus horti]|uniref:Pyrroline-5-carboxylate reductase n=1 Tax=Caldalkalibacillus horti TaxID=77523 RepID=A0ABT9W284_9BACI|nr:pyrroline-5-carboxylate reductase [Bacillus horti]MDQ0167368.1 pyrroline-5-carboxylate reductase [Bacillus horti]